MNTSQPGAPPSEDGADLIVSALLDERADGTMADSFTSAPIQWSRQDMTGAVRAVLPEEAVQRAAALIAAHPTGAVPGALMAVVRGAADLLNGNDDELTSTSPEIALAAVEQAELAVAAGLHTGEEAQWLVPRQARTAQDHAAQALTMAQDAAVAPESLPGATALSVASFVLQMSAGRLVRDVQDLPGGDDPVWIKLPRVYDLRQRIIAFIPQFIERGGFSFELLEELEVNPAAALSDGVL